MVDSPMAAVDPEAVHECHAPNGCNLDTPWATRWVGPGLGEYTDEIPAGFGSDQVGDLREAGVI